MNTRKNSPKLSHIKIIEKANATVAAKKNVGAARKPATGAVPSIEGPNAAGIRKISGTIRNPKLPKSPLPSGRNFVAGYRTGITRSVALGFIALFACEMFIATMSPVAASGEIRGLYFSTSDAYANFMNPTDPLALHTFHLTNTIAINFQYFNYEPPWTARTYRVTFTSPSGTVVKAINFAPKSPGETSANLTGIYLDPAVFAEEGTYKVQTDIYAVNAHGVHVDASNITSVRITRDVLDILAEYTDQIYLETSTTAYHHDVLVNAQAAEAGSTLPAPNLPLDVYWLEPGGNYSKVVSLITNASGEIRYEFTRFNTVAPADMQLKASTAGNLVYAPASSDQKSPLWGGHENIQHVIVNAGNATASPLSAYTNGAPLTLALTNKDGFLYTPNSGNGGIEDANFTTDPFANDVAYGFGSTSTSLGWGAQVTCGGATESNPCVYSTAGSPGMDSVQVLAPQSVTFLAGTPDPNYALSDLASQDGQGVTVAFHVPAPWDSVHEPYVDCQLRYSLEPVPADQVASACVNVSLAFSAPVTLNTIQVSCLTPSGSEELLFTDAISGATAYARVAPLPLAKLNLAQGFTIDVAVVGPNRTDVPVLVDQCAVTLDLTPNATRSVSWDSANSGVTFAVIGGTANGPGATDPSDVAMGTEVKIPAVPYYELDSATASVTFAMSCTANVQQPDGKFQLAVTPQPGAPGETYPLASTGAMVGVSGTYTIFQNLTYSIPPSNGSVLVYLSLALDASGVCRGDEVAVHLDSLLVTAFFERVDSSFSDIEVHNVPVANNSAPVSPSAVQYPTEQDPLSLAYPLNAVVPYGTGSRSFNFTFDSSVLSTGTFSAIGSTWAMTPAATSVWPYAAPIVTLAPGTPAPVVSGDRNSLLSADDQHPFTIQFGLETTREVVSTNGTAWIGHEYTLVTNGTQVLADSGALMLGANCTAILSIPLSQAYAGFYNATLALAVLTNESDAGTYAITTRPVATPASWDTPFMELNYATIPEGSNLWLGPRSSPAPATIASTVGNVTWIRLDVTRAVASAITAGASNLTFVVNATQVAGGTSGKLSTEDAAFWESQGMNAPASSNSGEITCYAPATAAVGLSDPSFLECSQALAVRYAAQDLNLNLLISNGSAGGSWTPLGVLPATSNIFQNWTSTIHPSDCTDGGEVELLFSPSFAPLAAQGTPAPQFAVDLVEATHSEFAASFDAGVPASAKVPYTLDLAGLPVPAGVETGLVEVQTAGQLFPVWNVSSRDYTTRLTSALNPAWADASGSTLLFHVRVFFLTQANASVTFTSFAVRAASATLATKDPAGAGGSQTFDFDSGVQYDSLLASWAGNGEGYLRVQYEWAPTLAGPFSVSSETALFSSGGTNEDVIPLVDAQGNPLDARVLIVWYRLVVSSPGPAFTGPVLYSLVVNATRKTIGDVTSLAQADDGNELQFSMQSHAASSATVTFTVDSTRTADPALLVLVDYVEFPGIGAAATTFLDEYNVAALDVVTGEWANLSLGIRGSATPDAYYFASLAPFVNATGQVLIRYSFIANHFLNVHMDYASLCYYRDSASLLGSPYYQHFNLPRASDDVQVSPTGVSAIAPLLGSATAASPGSYDQVAQITDASSGHLAGVQLLRTLTDYASGNVGSNTAVGASNKTVISPVFLYNKVTLPAGAVQASYTFNASDLPPSTQWFYSSPVFSWDMPVAVSGPGEYAAEFYGAFSTVLVKNTPNPYGGEYSAVDYSTMTSASASLANQSDVPPFQIWGGQYSLGWYNPINYWNGYTHVSGTGNVFQNASGYYLPVYFQGWWGQSQWFWWYAWNGENVNWTITVSLNNYVVKLCPAQDPLSLTSSVTVDIPLHIRDSLDLRGILLAGSFAWTGAENVPAYIADDDFGTATMAYQLELSKVSQIGSTSVNKWGIPTFTGGPSSQGEYFVGWALGSYGGSYNIPYSGSTGSGIDPSFAFCDSQGNWWVRAKFEVTYTRHYVAGCLPDVWVNPLQAPDAFSFDMSLQLSASNLRAVSLLGNSAFQNWTNRAYFDFGATFAVSVSDLTTAQYNITAANAWYFAQHLKFSVLPQWDNAPGTYANFASKSMAYSLDLAIAKDAGFGQVTWVEFNPGVFGTERPLTQAVEAGTDYSIILAESADRASQDDPNALRLGATDIRDFFVNGTTLLFRITLTIHILNVADFDYQIGADWQAAPHKQLQVQFESYTDIDHFLSPPLADNYQELTQDLPVPGPANPALAGQVSYANLDIAGTVALLGAEYAHFDAATALGVRVGITTPAAGRQVLAECALNGSEVVPFWCSLTIYSSKLAGLSSVSIFVDVGYWHGRWLGLYDAVGVVETSLTYFRCSFVYSTGYLDVSAGRAYVDKEVDIDAGGPFPANTTSIVVTADLTSAIQGLQANADGTISQQVSFVQPYVKIYDWGTGAFDPMAVFSLGGTQYQFVLDTLTGNPADYSSGGHVKLLVVLDGRFQLPASSAFEDSMYAAHLVINNMQVAFNSFGTPNTPGTYSKVKPTGDILSPDPWQVPALPFRCDLAIPESSLIAGTSTIGCTVRFTNSTSSGMYPYNVAVFGANGTLPFSIQPTQWNGSLVAAALVRVQVSPATSLLRLGNNLAGVRIYWSVAASGVAFVNVTATAPVYNGTIILGATEAFASTIPFLATASPNLPAAVKLDFSLYPLSSPSATAEQQFYFDVASQADYPAANITGAAVQFVVSSAQSLSFEVGLYNAPRKAFDYFAVPPLQAQDIYFPVNQTRLFVVPLDLSEFWAAYSDLGGVLGSVKLTTEGGTPVQADLNLIEIKLTYNAAPVAVANQTYAPYIEDQGFLSSLIFWDSFSDANLARRYLGDVADFGMQNGLLTKTDRWDPSFWDWLCSWWLPPYSPSYLFANATAGLSAYYASFKFNIQDTCQDYKTVEWLANAGSANSWWAGTYTTGLLFRLHSLESDSCHAGELEIWRKQTGDWCWSLQAVVSLPLAVHVGQWYAVETHVNGSLVELWLNGTQIYSGNIAVNSNRGYFGFRAEYYHEYYAGDLVISNQFIPGDGNMASHFASVSAALPPNNELRYGDAVNATITPMAGYAGPVANQEVNLMVNSTDGWLYLDQGLTNSAGNVSFPIDTVDLYTQNLLGSAYPRTRELELASNTTRYYAQDSFNGGYALSWSSNHLNDFSTASGYLAKTGPSRESYLLTAPTGLPSNYTIEFRALANTDPSREKCEWVVDSDGNLGNAYVYRLYSATSSEDPNALRVYQVSGGNWNEVADVPVAPEVLVGQWQAVKMTVSQDAQNAYHQVFLNDEQIYAGTYPLSGYTARSYLGFRIYDPGQSEYANFSVYTGAATWQEVPVSSPYMQNANYTTSFYPAVKYTADGITRVDNLAVATSPYNLTGGNSIDLEVNLTFPGLLNEYGQPFHLGQYYGIRVGVLLPYDDGVVQSVTAYVVDGQGNRNDFVLDGAALQELYNDPTSRAVFINGTRLIQAFIDIGLKDAWNASLANLQVLGVECQRQAVLPGPYAGYYPPNAVGIASVQFVRQLNNFSYSNFDFGAELESQVAIWYQGNGSSYSTFLVFPHVFFRRTPATLTVTSPGAGAGLVVPFGNDFWVAVNLTYGAGAFVPVATMLIAAAFVLIVRQRNQRVIGGFEVPPSGYLGFATFANYTFDVRPFVDAGTYPGAEVMWFGNGLFCNAFGAMPAPLSITPAPTSTSLLGDNLGFDYGYPASFDGRVQDAGGELLKDQEEVLFWENFTGPLQVKYTLYAPGATASTSGNFTLAGQWGAGDRAQVYGASLSPENYTLPFANLFTFRYFTNTTALQFTATLHYSVPGAGRLDQARTFCPSATSNWVTVFMDAQLGGGAPAGAAGPAVITGFTVTVQSLANQEALVTFTDFEVAHAPVAYLQVRQSDFAPWRNLTAVVVSMDTSTESRFSLPVFVKGTQFLLNNPCVDSSGTTSLGGVLAAGDYQIRVAYAGDGLNYLPSSTTTLMRVRPIQTALFSVPDTFGGATRDGFYAARTYNSTTLFALDEGQPYTLLSLGYTWGEHKNATFLLSPASGGFNGIPDKPVWIQVGIVPATSSGLQGRDYFADYYPTVRNVASGQLIFQPAIAQGKYAPPLIYDYYDFSAKQEAFYGPYLWMVGVTDANGTVTFPLDFGPSLLEDLLRIFPGQDISTVKHDLFIRVFYSSSFAWSDMALPVGDSDTGQGYLCTQSEYARNAEHVFTAGDENTWMQVCGSPYYTDPEYSSCYAEGSLACRQADLNVTGQDIAVTNQGGESDVIPLLAYASMTFAEPNGTTVTEPFTGSDFNKIDEVSVFFVISDQMTGTIVIGDPQGANPVLLETHPDRETGRIYLEINGSLLDSLVPGYYTVGVYLAESGHYHAAEGSYQLLLKSQYTYDFTSPTTLVDFSSQMDTSGRPFYSNATSGQKEYALAQDFIYPVLKGCAWVAADPDPTKLSAGAGVTISLNGYPIIDQVIHPYGGPVPFEMSLEYFEGKQLTFNVSTWINETQIGRDVEYPFEAASNAADWVHVNATIFEPTFADPVNGQGAYDVVGQFKLLAQAGAVSVANVYPATDSRAVRVENSTPAGQDTPMPALLVYPTGLGNIPTSVAASLNYTWARAPFAALDTADNATSGEQLLAGYVVPGGTFADGIRHAVVHNPLAPASDAPVTSIMVNAARQWRGLEYPDTYCPFEGFFEGIMYVPNLTEQSPAEDVQFQVLVDYGTPGSYVLVNETLTGGGPADFLHVTATIPAAFYSSQHNITLQVRSLGVNSYQAFWVQCNFTGREDVIYTSTYLPFGRVALFLGNFLYYYIPSAASLHMDPSSAHAVWLCSEDTPGLPSVPAGNYDLAPDMLRVYGQTDTQTFAQQWQTMASGQAECYTFQPNQGVFVRNRFFSLGSISAPEVHAGFYSIYNSTPSGLMNYNALLGRRKVTLVVTPPEWVTHPASESLQWGAAGANYSAPLDPATLNRAANATVARVYYVQDPYPQDLVYEHWDYFRFKAHWGLNASSAAQYDYWYHEVAYSQAVYQTGAPGTTAAGNFLDFYPDSGNKVDWLAYSELVVNFAVNDTSVVNELRVELYSGSKLLAPPQLFAITSNASRNYAVSIAGVDLRAVSRVNLVGVPDDSHLTASAQGVMLTSEGVALSAPACQVRFGVTYANGTSVETPLPRSYFGQYTPIDVPLDVSPASSPVVGMYFTGTAGGRINLQEVAIVQTFGAGNASADNVTADYSFDTSGQTLANINRFLAGQPIVDPSLVWAAGAGVKVTSTGDPYTKFKFTDINKDGIYDTVERWDDLGRQGFDSGIGNVYSLDSHNDGVWDKTIVHDTETSVVPAGDGSNGVIVETKTVATVTNLVQSQVGNLYVSEEYASYQSNYRDVWSSDVLTHTISLTLQGAAQPFYINEEREEWPLYNGQVDYQVHEVSTWDDQIQAYDVKVWNDWAATVDVAMLGTTTEYHRGVTGILDQGVTSVPLDPVAPIDQDPLPGTILWICSYAPGAAVAPFYDEGLVLLGNPGANQNDAYQIAVDSSDQQLAGAVQAGYRLCTGIILDVNRDHVWEQERPGAPTGGADARPCDDYVPIWEVSPHGLAVLRTMAHAAAWQDWLAANSNAEGITKVIVDFAVVLALSAAFSYVAGPIIGAFAGAFVASVINPIINMWISDQFHPGYMLTQWRWQINEGIIMSTPVAPEIIHPPYPYIEGAVTPEVVYDFYNAHYQGYDVPVVATFQGPPTGVPQWLSPVASLYGILQPEPGSANYVVDTKMWLPENQVPPYYDPSDILGIVWSVIQNPFGLFKTGYGLWDTEPDIFQVYQYQSFLDQRAALSSAYSQDLGLGTGKAVTIFVTRTAGKPVVVAVEDDRAYGGLSSFWNFSDRLVTFADQCSVAYAAKFEGFKQSDWESTLCTVAIFVAEMVAQQFAVSLVTGWAWSLSEGGEAEAEQTGVTWTLKGALKTMVGKAEVSSAMQLGNTNLFVEIMQQAFAQQFFLGSAGNFLQEQLQASNPAAWAKVQQWMLPGWTLGDYAQWLYGAIQSARNYNKHSEQMKAGTAQDEADIGMTYSVPPEVAVDAVQQLAVREAVKFFEADAVCEAVQEELTSWQQELNDRLRTAIQQVGFANYYAQAGVAAAECDAVAKPYLENSVMNDHQISAAQVMQDLTLEIVQERHLLVNQAHFDLCVETQDGSITRITWDDPAAQNPFTSFLSNPDIVRVWLDDPTDNHQTSFDEYISHSEEGPSPQVESSLSKRDVTSAFLDSSIYPEISQTDLKPDLSMDRGTQGTHIDPSLWGVVEGVTGLTMPVDGYISKDIFNALSALGIHHGVDIAYLGAVGCDPTTGVFDYSKVEGILSETSYWQRIAGAGNTMKVFIDFYVREQDLLSVEKAQNPQSTGTNRIFSSDPAPWDFLMTDFKGSKGYKYVFSNILGKDLCEIAGQEVIEKQIIDGITGEMTVGKIGDVYFVAESGESIIIDGKFDAIGQDFWNHHIRNSEQGLGYIQASIARDDNPKTYILMTTEEGLLNYYQKYAVLTDSWDKEMKVWGFIDPSSLTVSPIYDGDNLIGISIRGPAEILMSPPSQTWNKVYWTQPDFELRIMSAGTTWDLCGQMVDRVKAEVPIMNQVVDFTQANLYAALTKTLPQ